ncbi:small multi-drug export protein [Streptobacillus felis]|uniref:Small multi-drug export protein n=1 Tax=Streptobacillus felis TaxID=1384509 RepID=A0A7Z0T7Z6_9FUSO|nr:small multi-drug export protein [Streptobacillus felis]NYV27364.1 small multi-drug export protein [Streptobacillus felis]
MFIKYLNILIISATPFIELRGAIPVSQLIGLPLIPSILVSIVGNIIPIPFAYFFSKKILLLGKDSKIFGKLFSYILNKGHKAGEKIMSKSGNGIFLALLLFVAIPVPGTGAYSAILAATLLDIDFKKSFISIFFGIIIAGLLITIFTFLVKFFV